MSDASKNGNGRCYRLPQDALQVAEEFGEMTKTPALVGPLERFFQDISSDPHLLAVALEVVEGEGDERSFVSLYAFGTNGHFENSRDDLAGEAYRRLESSIDDLENGLSTEMRFRNVRPDQLDQAVSTFTHEPGHAKNMRVTMTPAANGAA